MADQLRAQIAERERATAAYLDAHRAHWGIPHEHRLGRMIAELAELYDRAGVNVFDRRFTAEDTPGA